MGFLSDWRQRRSARAYATKLGPWLAHSFGAAATYSPAQIRRAIEVLHLDENYVAFGYAAFLARQDYDPLVSRLPIRLSYGQARALLLRYGPDAPLHALGIGTVRAPDLARSYREAEGHAFEGEL
jgi:hypothetical protein